MSPFQRHIDACNNTPTPAHLLPFRIGAAQVGWVRPELAQALTFFPQDVHFDAGGVALASRFRTPAARSAALESLSSGWVTAACCASATSPSTSAPPPKGRCWRPSTAARYRPSA